MSYTMATRNSSNRKTPEDIIKKLKSNLSNLINCKRVCGVCLNNTRNLRFENTIYKVRNAENLKKRSLKDIIASTFGHKIISMLPTCYFCENCIDVILKAYYILEDIKYNHHILQYYSDKLTEQINLKLPGDMPSLAFELDYPKSDTFFSYENIKNWDSDATNYDDKTYDEVNENYSNSEFKLIKVENVKEETQSESKSKTVSLETIKIIDKLKDQITIKKLNGEPKEEKKENSCNIIFLTKHSKPRKILKKSKKHPQKNVENATVGLHGKKVIIDSGNKRKRAYKCFLCSSTFTGQKELLIHSRKLCIDSDQQNEIMSENNDSNFENDGSKQVCDQCGKLIDTRNLEKHKRVHQYFKCKVCNQFIFEKHYTRHLAIHNESKLKHCSDCDYTSRFSEVMDAHVNKVHLHVKPYTCGICHKSTHSKMLLREHVRTHSRHKTEQCHVCGDRFAYKKGLEYHLRIHTGYKPYKCDLCEESFITSSRRNQHKLTKHSERQFKCEICSKKFFIRGVLNRHLIGVHGKKNNSLTDKGPIPVKDDCL